MNNPILLIIQREFLSRVRKKTFLLVTILGPLVFAALLIVPGILASMPEDDKNIIVLDEAALIIPEEGRGEYQLEYLDPRENDLVTAKEFFAESEYDALLYIPTGENWDPDFIKNNILLFGKEDPSINMVQFLDGILEDRLNKQKLLRNGVDPEVVAQSVTQVNIQSFTVGEEGEEEQQSATGLKMGLGYIAGMFIYFFIFFYSVMVMRGVIEEKSSRIVEVIISSVRPFQLMMGKILGIGAVGVVQFVIWVVLSGGIYLATTTLIFPEMLAEQAAAGPGGPEAAAIQGFEIFDQLRAINFPLIIGGFVFYFFAGYFLYSAMFAALGSA
ncbi:MAG: ABC transporter permease, partial [Schleiferiaceae bacterium]